MSAKQLRSDVTNTLAFLAIVCLLRVLITNRLIQTNYQYSGHLLTAADRSKNININQLYLSL